jgi:hypothetical protein
VCKTSAKRGKAQIVSHALLSVLAVAWHVAAKAADLLPTHLIGTWGTGESLYAGTTAQNEFYLQGDGFGIAAGSTPPTGRIDSIQDGQRAPRAIIGFPVRATLDGDRLTVRPSLSGQEQVKQAAAMVISCQYGAANLTLACVGPDGAVFIMKRREKTVPTEVAQMIEALRLQSSAKEQKPSLP